MGKIRLLDPKLVNLIAAGEVVERPASVVKELIENSLDANATKIQLYVTEAGRELIKVVDNGSGIDKSDLELALTQHATSKISSPADLDKIYSLGFRGEALASIASVSQIQIDTLTTGAELGYKISNTDHQITPGERNTVGTTVTVAKLFGHTPARLKFLKTNSTEYQHIYDTFINIAIVNPQVHFEIYQDNKLELRLPAGADILTRIHDIWGEAVAKKLYHTQTPIPGGEATLYLGHPEAARKDRKLQYIFINGRYVSDKSLNKAITNGFSGFINRELFPSYFAMLTIDPTQTDVNIHPRKLEVRLEQAAAIFAALQQATSFCLNKETKHSLLAKLPDYGNHPNYTASPNTYSFTPTKASSDSVHQPGNSRVSSTTWHPSSPKSSVQKSIQFSQLLLEDSGNVQPGENVNPVPVQIFNTYIAYVQGEELVFIDQHAAAEKILYEKLSGQAGTIRSRPLLTPIIIDLPKQIKKDSVLEQQSELLRQGLEISDFGGNSIQITALPELAPNLNVEEFLQELLTRDDPGVDWPSLSQNGLSQSVHIRLATMACHGAIRAGQRLTVPEMQQIISDLKLCKLPYNCPHGRPVSWSLTRNNLEKNFKRII